MRAARVVAEVGPPDWVVLGAAQDWAAIPSPSVFRGASWGAGGQFVAELLGHYHLAVLARVGVRLEGAAGPPPAEAAVRRGKAGEVRVVRGRLGARGWCLEGRELGQAAQLERRRLVIEAIAGVGRVWLVGRRCYARVAGSAGRSGSLCADDRGRTVDLAEVGQRDLCGSCQSKVSAKTPTKGVPYRKIHISFCLISTTAWCTGVAVSCGRVGSAAQLTGVRAP